MPLTNNCEKCSLVYEVIAFEKPDGTTDGQMSKCPRCSHWNGTKYHFDKYKKKSENS